jgi:hypothetical protein
MVRKMYLIFLINMGLLIPNGCMGQAEKHTASSFAVRIFSSANFMGYLEPCG